MKFLAPLSAILGLASAASLQQVWNFGSNPSGEKMYIYVPDRLAFNPAVVVAIHYCSGTGQGYFNANPGYRQNADSKGFIVVFPESAKKGECWDVSSQATLSHNGGGASNAIANMIKYTLDKYSGDPNKVYVTGSSSGAMMTNVMAATYPELVQKGVVYSGVPAGCFVSSWGGVMAWNGTCSGGNSIASAEKWADVVHDMYPGYTGEYPAMQIYHGDADTILRPQNYFETIKQWAGVDGYDPDRPVKTLSSTPKSKYTTYVFGPKLTGIYANGVGHGVPVIVSEDMKFFGL